MPLTKKANPKHARRFARIHPAQDGTDMIYEAQDGRFYFGAQFTERASVRNWTEADMVEVIRRGHWQELRV